MKTFFGKYSTDQKLADLHVHTNKSNGLMTPKQVVDLAFESKLLQAIAITDHDSILPAVEAKQYAQKMGYPLEVIVGSEISTSTGHIIGLYLERDVSSNNPVEWTITQIHKQKGLAIVPHPFFLNSLSEKTMFDVMNNPDPSIYFDGFEIFNANSNNNLKYQLVKKTTIFYLEHKTKLGAPIGVSGAHYFTVGRGATGFKETLSNAITSTQTSVAYLDQQETSKLVNQTRDLFPKEIEKVKYLYENLQAIEINNQ